MGIMDIMFISCTALGAIIYLMLFCQLAWFLFEEFMIWFGCHGGRPMDKIPMYRLFNVYIEPMLDRHIFPIKRDAFFIGAFADGERRLVFQPWMFLQGIGWVNTQHKS